MKDQRSTTRTDAIDALTPLLGTLFTGLAFVVAFLAAQPGMMA